MVPIREQTETLLASPPHEIDMFLYRSKAAKGARSYGNPPKSVRSLSGFSTARSSQTKTGLTRHTVRSGSCMGWEKIKKKQTYRLFERPSDQMVAKAQ